MGSILPVLFIAFGAYVFWSMFTKAGKGKMLGGKIIHTAHDEIVQKEGIGKAAIRAHLIEKKNGSKHVGIEISENSKLAASMKPIKLSKHEAEVLIGMLKEIAEKT